TWLDADVGVGAPRLALDARREHHRAARLPAVLLEEVGDAAYGVGRIAPEVDRAVAVEVDGEAPLAARHELRDADRAGVRAAHGKDIEAQVAREQQVLLELVAEIGGARGVVECEGSEGI